MQNQHTLLCLAAQTTTQWVTLDQKSFQVTHSMLETNKKNVKKTLQECQSENYKSAAPSDESSEAITVANQMHRTTLLHYLNTE